MGKIIIRPAFLRIAVFVITTILFADISQAQVSNAQKKPTCCLIKAFRCQVEPNNKNIVLFRSFPFTAPEQIEIPGNGQGFLNVIANQDAVSLTIAGLKARNNPKGSNSRNRFFYSDTTPNSILVFRGNQVTVFPRLLLIHPVVQKSLMLHGDRIATFNMESDISPFPYSELESDTKNDPSKTAELDKLRVLNATDSIHAWYSNNVSRTKQEKKVSVTVSGLLAPATARGQRTFGLADEGRFITDLSTFLDDSGDGTIKEELQKTAARYSSNLPIAVVVHRQIGAYSFRQIVPLKGAGALGKDSRFYQQVFSDPEAAGNNWSRMFDPFSKIRLVDGDVIEIASLGSVPLFSRLGL